MDLKSEVRKLANPERAKVMQGFFKTGKGQYGEGDIFLGLSVPQSREVASKFTDLSLIEIKKYLQSEIHEERLIALLILVSKYKKADNKKEIFDFYISNAEKINNWDLVDSSADKIVGSHLIERDKDVLYKLAKSENLWLRRISIVSTYFFIKNNKFAETLKIAEMLINDRHDLIHKACGWMLREVGKRDLGVLRKFLDKNAQEMPRTMLRYSIEKLSPEERLKYMKNG